MLPEVFLSVPICVGSERLARKFGICMWVVLTVSIQSLNSNVPESSLEANFHSLLHFCTLHRLCGIMIKC